MAGQASLQGGRDLVTRGDRQVRGWSTLTLALLPWRSVPGAWAAPPRSRVSCALLSSASVQGTGPLESSTRKRSPISHSGVSSVPETTPWWFSSPSYQPQERDWQ